MFLIYLGHRSRVGPSVSLHGRKIQSQKNNTLNLSSVQLQIGWKRGREGDANLGEKKKHRNVRKKMEIGRGESRMQPCLLTREKYTFQREIKLHLPHCCIPSDIATHLALLRSHRRKTGRDWGGRRKKQKEKEPTSICFSHIDSETMFVSNTHTPFFQCVHCSIAFWPTASMPFRDMNLEAASWHQSCTCALPHPPHRSTAHHFFRLPYQLKLSCGLEINT